jgi:IS30 family transposase
MAAICIATCDARNNAVNVMVLITAVANSLTASVLMNDPDWVIGKNHKQVIVSLTERKSCYTLIQKVNRKTAQCVTNAIINLLSPYSDKVHTLTSDNGKEFAEHKTIADKLNARFYFAHPYASWERGLNENTNGLIRQYFPKGRDFTMITQKEINRAMNRMNNRLRKCFGIKTPNQVF